MQENGGYGDYPPPGEAGGYGYPPPPPQPAQAGYGSVPPPPGQPGQPGYGGYGYPPPPPPPRHSGVWRFVVVAVTAAALGAGSVLAIGHSTGTPVATSPPSSGNGQTPNLPNGGASNGLGNGFGNNGQNNAEQAVFNKVAPGLVIISTSLNYNSEAAAGTGMVLSSDGVVLTNNHVIASATSISATVVATGKTYRAKVLGYDASGDIAAIQLQGASGLRTIPVGDSGSVKVGDQVLAMGNAQGQNQIVPAAGHVVRLNQTVQATDENSPAGSETLHGTIQTDAAIISGDSGGPLANSSGQVIGMNTAGNNGGNVQQSAAGFAIPINTALGIVNQIKSGQASSTVSIGYPAFLGIFDTGSTSASPQAQAQRTNQSGAGQPGAGQPACASSNSDLAPLSSIAPVSHGTLVIGVICGSPAANVGMGAGDVITAVNGHQVGAPTQLQSLLSGYKVGDTITMTWADLNGQSHSAQLRLVAGPPR